MKCDKLKPLVFSISDLAYVDESRVEKNFENPHDHAVYKATEVDAAIAELKAKLESVQASAYADSVDAGMRERRLQRALWITRGAVHKAKRMAMYGLLQAYPLWEGSPAGLEVHKNIHRYDGYERKCLKKAEEYR